MAEVCGTGSGNFPQPGDPDLNGSILNVSPAFGGIDVVWTYPGLNPQAVAHTILFRSTNADPATKVQHRIVTGNFHYDKVDPGQNVEYFYWIQIVSVNGTVGDLIGPASATARPTIEHMLLLLTGRIDDSALGQALKGEIQRLDSLTSALNTETSDRWNQYVQLQTDLGVYQNDVDGVATLVADEVARLDSSDTAQVNQINLIAAKSGDNAAAVVAEQTARADADSALAQSVTTLQSTLGDEIAQVETNAQTDIDTLNGEVTNIGALYTTKVNVNGLIGGFGVYNDGSEVLAGFDVDTFFVGRTQADKVKPFIIKDGETFIDEAVIQSLTFNKLRSADGSLMFTPAVYDGLGNVTEDGKLLVDYLDVDNLVATQAKSPNFAAGSTGWQLNADGSAELQDAVVRGHIKMDTGYIADSVSIGGLGNFAYKNSLFYNEVSGTKPPDNADKTSSNTSNDTYNVAGRNATTVKDEAINGNDYVNYWKRPEDVTTIDGNKIFTGDAYVDTLQIKGQAVTFPRGVQASSNRTVSSRGTNVLSIYVSATGAPLIITGTVNFSDASDLGYFGKMALYRGGRLLFGPVTVATAYASGSSRGGTLYSLEGGSAIQVYIPTGVTGTYYLQCSGTGNTNVDHRSLTVTEAKR